MIFSNFSSHSFIFWALVKSAHNVACFISSKKVPVTLFPPTIAPFSEKQIPYEAYPPSLKYKLSLFLKALSSKWAELLAE